MGITLGIIGGIAPPSTVDYYRALVDGYRERRPDAYPSIIINSIDLTRLLGLIGDGRMDELVDWLAAEIDRLARAGAGCALLAANTPLAFSGHGSRCWERSILTSLPGAG